ncbi:hypothetical protein DY052_06325 [Apilactobacillus timberlakei]|uniref:helix-turn-helix domain-containing protein n=1 Tax=Apilactobacillus timberlakei TaxID=2008380 RepID=UPI00112E49FA|nr:helix-turn-helix transcriptional regulator [Apilactobacillus timberlakei]TPR15040.1 hypothetical protein DY052_06325 [Apilactobacillus timberlakei]
MQYWENIKWLAEQNHLNSSSFGRKTGLSYLYLTAAVQKQYKVPNRDTLIKISNAFDLNPNDIFENADNEYLKKASQKYKNTFWKKFIEPKMNRYLTMTRIAKETEVNRNYLSGLKNGYIAYPNERVVVVLAAYFHEPSLKWFNWINENLDSLKMKIGENNENVE